MITSSISHRLANTALQTKLQLPPPASRQQTLVSLKTKTSIHIAPRSHAKRRLAAHHCTLHQTSSRPTKSVWSRMDYDSHGKRTTPIWTFQKFVNSRVAEKQPYLRLYTPYRRSAPYRKPEHSKDALQSFSATATIPIQSSSICRLCLFPCFSFFQNSIIRPRVFRALSKASSMLYCVSCL